MEQKTKKTTKGSTTAKKTVTNASKKEPKLTDYSFNQLVYLANDNYRRAQETLKGYFHHDIVSDNAIEDLKMAALLNHAEAQYFLSKKLIDKHEYTEAVLWCRRSANNGCHKAEKLMGDIYRSGMYGEERDLERALFFYKKAAEGGNVKSWLVLARMFKKGEYVQQDYQEALRYYTKVLMVPDDNEYGNSHWEANQALAEMHLLGLGTPENGAKAALYCMENAQRGDDTSAYQAGEIFYYGLAGVEKDIPEAIRWYEMAAQMSCPNPKALLKLARIYEEGVVGVPINLSLALKYYKKFLNDERLAYDYLGDLFESVFAFVEKKIADIEKRIAADQTPSES